MCDNKVKITWTGIIRDLLPIFARELLVVTGSGIPIQIYGIPRGGQVIVGLLCAAYPRFFINVDKPEDTNIFIDDIYDSGETVKRWENKYKKKVYCLVERCKYNGYVIFPWEEADIEKEKKDYAIRLLQILEGDITLAHILIDKVGRDAWVIKE